MIIKCSKNIKLKIESGIPSNKYGIPLKTKRWFVYLYSKLGYIYVGYFKTKKKAVESFDWAISK